MPRRYPAHLAKSNTQSHPPIDRFKSPLTAVDDEAVRLVDVLQAHPDTSDVTDASHQGDIVFTAAGDTWVLDFQFGADGEVFQSPTDTPTPADQPAADALRDVVVPALLARPAYRAATADDDTLTVHLATGRHYTLALTPAA
ncbi:hypothetical protein OG321_34905 [Streptomyces sp. NBC_00424]|uniref:hypothetical protein n=1 Tax=Streptomyces sp. NBC_00424 TaxID=2903648 RepID=UPI00225A296B|nr:hypothetical protein [Streptomyces sp. NBC_00424]MCX5077671.1 hypothetical protein [Streptomyces sp. NBC_00424]